MLRGIWHFGSSNRGNQNVPLVVEGDKRVEIGLQRFFFFGIGEEVRANQPWLSGSRAQERGGTREGSGTRLLWPVEEKRGEICNTKNLFGGDEKIKSSARGLSGRLRMGTKKRGRRQKLD